MVPGTDHGDMTVDRMAVVAGGVDGAAKGRCKVGVRARSGGTQAQCQCCWRATRGSWWARYQRDKDASGDDDDGSEGVEDTTRWLKRVTWCKEVGVSEEEKERNKEIECMREMKRRDRIAIFICLVASVRSQVAMFLLAFSRHSATSTIHPCTTKHITHPPTHLHTHRDTHTCLHGEYGSKSR
jgi:hypothetical protein